MGITHFLKKVALGIQTWSCRIVPCALFQFCPHFDCCPFYIDAHRAWNWGYRNTGHHCDHCTYVPACTSLINEILLDYCWKLLKILKLRYSIEWIRNPKLPFCEKDNLERRKLHPFVIYKTSNFASNFHF